MTTIQNISEPINSSHQTSQDKIDQAFFDMSPKDMRLTVPEGVTGEDMATAISEKLINKHLYLKEDSPAAQDLAKRLAQNETTIEKIFKEQQRIVEILSPSNVLIKGMGNTTHIKPGTVLNISDIEGRLGFSQH